jgi:hypothetical protein
MVKRIVNPSFTSSDPPTHLLRTNVLSQRDFLKRVDKSMSMRHWEVYETGWPYSNGNITKRAIALLAIWLGGRNIAGVTFGNRFKAIGEKLGNPSLAPPEQANYQKRAIGGNGITTV